MSAYGPPCEDCVGCETCDRTAYCLNDTGRPCPHDRALCDGCVLAGECADCRTEMTADMFHTGQYNPHADPLFDAAADANKRTDWSLDGFDPITNRRTR